MRTKQNLSLSDVLISDPDIVSGAIIFKGTRVPLEAFFENLANGMSLNEVLDNFPTVERIQAERVLELASELLQSAVLARGEGHTG